jgi:hypothetical protein
MSVRRHDRVLDSPVTRNGLVFVCDAAPVNPPGWCYFISMKPARGAEAVIDTKKSAVESVR